ncbi:MAG: hypothetical protein M3169_17545 [Candidatus Eremiobacteraeota bacterium]|nr:hypothetical protein [Candidatus Eremiobacteraeota bacterium]
MADGRLAALAATVGAFHLTDRAMRGAQERIERALAASDVDDATAQAYIDAVRRYFEPYEREAQGQLRHVDRELERLYLHQFNLTAERGVVGKRMEAVRGVLTALAELRAE